MTTTAVPTLTVAGTAVGGSDPAAALVAVDQLRLTWGRSSVLETPTPATVQLTVRDNAPRSPFARRADLIGQPVVIGWESLDAGYIYTGVSFRGRITDAAPRPNRRGGFDVALAASSLEVDLANIRAPAGTSWPAETFSSRALRIQQLFPTGSFPGGVELPDAYALGLRDPAQFDPRSLGAAAVDVSGRDALSLLRELFASTSPLPMVYDPAAQRLAYASRRRFAYDTTRGLTISARLVSSPAHGGRFVAASLLGLHLDSQLTAYDGDLQHSLDSRLTRVEVQWLDETAAYAEKTTAADTADTAAEPTIGRRTLAVSTIHAQAGGAAQLAGFYVDVVNREARTPRFGPVGFSSAREPFADVAHVGFLLAGHERFDTLCLGRSWLTRLRERPLVGILGGTVVYAGGQWTVELIPAPTIIDPYPYAWGPVTVAAAAKPPPVTTPPTPPVRLADVDRSVTFGDMAFIDMGAGFSAGTVLPYKGNPS